MSRRVHHAGRRQSRPTRPAGEGHAHEPVTEIAPRGGGGPNLETVVEPEATVPAESVIAAPGAPLPGREPAAPAEPVIAANQMAPIEPSAQSRARPGNGGQSTGPGRSVENAGCTDPQLRRFIKSRAYVPMHELRRRFGLTGDDDDVTGVEVERGRRVYVGLPNREGNLLGDLFRAGDVGYELSLDPISPIVVGVFPMRPIARG